MLQPVPEQSPSERFDAGFYRRYYRDPQTRVVTPGEMSRRANFIAAFMRHLELEVRSILDIGCGLGLLRRQLLRPNDLVICYDVLQYLDDREAGAAMRNLGQLCGGALHFGVLTREDWDRYCDKRLTDRDVHLRPSDWYRRRLAPSFLNAGSGMFVRRGTIAQLWDLDRL